MARVCPERDAACPHGMACPYADDRYSCKPGWQSPTSPTTPRTARAPESSAQPDPAVEAEYLKELVASLRKDGFTLSADTITRLAAEKAQRTIEKNVAMVVAEQMEEERDAYRARADKAEAELSALKQRVAEVLGFYAREWIATGYEVDPNEPTDALWNDRGRRAAELHAALQTTDGRLVNTNVAPSNSAAEGE